MRLSMSSPGWIMIRYFRFVGCKCWFGLYAQTTCVCLQVSDLSSKLKEMRQYWIQLPVALCGKVAPVGTGQDKCWNGITKARWGRNLLTEPITELFKVLNATSRTSQTHQACSSFPSKLDCVYQAATSIFTIIRFIRVCKLWYMLSYFPSSQSQCQ